MAKRRAARKPKRKAGRKPAPIRHGTDLSLNEQRASYFFKKELRRCERAWHGGSVPALIDAVILCHQEQKSMPLWVAQGEVTLITGLVEGKNLLQQRGRLGKALTRYRSALIDLARYDAVKELEDRKEELPSIIRGLSPKGADQRPQFVALARNDNLDQRCAAVSELFQQTNNLAKGEPDTIMRSYKKVTRDLRHDHHARYFIPSYHSPLFRLLCR